MTNKLSFVIIIFSIFIITSSCSDTKTLKDTENTSTEQIQQDIENVIPESVDTIPVQRAAVAKMIALAFNDKSDIEIADTEIQFRDVDSQQWYSPYINTVVSQNYMSGFENMFKPDEPLSLKEAQILLDKLNPQNKTKIKMTADIEDKPISYALWTQLYINMLTDMAQDETIESLYSIQKQQMIVLTTPANNSTQNAWTMTTDKGDYSFSGLNMDSYIDCKIEVYTKGNEIVAFLNVIDTSPTITNAYLLKADANSVDIFVGGVKRSYKANSIGDIQADIVDIKINQNSVVDIIPIENQVEGRFIRAKNGYIELQDKNMFSITDDIKVYSIVGENVQWKSIKDIVSGTDIARYTLKDGKICAAIIYKTFIPEKIRVAIGTSDFKSLIHKNIKLTATTDYTVSYGNVQQQYKKGDIFEINPQIDTRVYIKTLDNSGKIELKSITRNSGLTPKYRGIIEIAKQDEGYSIVNDIDLEQYLYSVVPSEMPNSYGIEAAKVQAITARSYAYNQIFSNKYYQYGANVDDSTQSQVYNNVAETDNAIEAVNNTKGKVLTYNDTVISANFFSTSSGMTANSGEVWMNAETKKFPDDTPVYLKSVKQYQNKDYGNLTEEQNAYSFFKNMAVDSYDSEFSWFRWYLTMSMDELSASINANIQDRYRANKSAIKTKVAEGVYRSKDIDSIGTLKDIQITKRGEGGNIMEIILVGTEATVKVLTEYNIRTLLRPSKYSPDKADVILYRKDGSKLSNYTLLPSAFFTMDKNLDKHNNIKSITFYGGGNGHGVGMSQNGVKIMADRGFSCEQILEHYYTDTQIQIIQ